MPSQPLRLEIIERPTVEPVGMQEAKLKLHLDDQETENDAIVAGLLRASTEQAQKFTRRALITQIYSLWLDCWPSDYAAVNYPEGWYEGSQLAEERGRVRRYVEIPRPPLQSVEYIKTYDENDAETVYDAANYFVDTATEPGRVVLRQGATPPDPGRVANGIEIRFTAGYGNQWSLVPEAIRAGILADIEWSYEGCAADKGSEGMAMMAQKLWTPYRILKL